MALRKASAYSHRYARPFTRRSKAKKYNYIKMVPPNKIVKMDMGDVSGFNNGKYQIIFRLITTEKIQIRDNALESARQVLIKALEANVLGNFAAFLKMHPHHILREHAMLTGAGADRMSKGMTLSYGVPKGRAAMAKPGEEIFVVGVNSEKGKRIARAALTEVRSKLPGTCKILVTERKQAPREDKPIEIAA